MSDWSGSESQRRRDREDCLYPNASPTPGPKVYRIAKGTTAIARRSSDRSGKMIRTTKDLEFDEPYHKRGSRLEFFSVGWILSVESSDVSIDSARSGNLNG